MVGIATPDALQDIHEVEPIQSLDDLNRTIILPEPVLHAWLERHKFHPKRLANGEVPEHYKDLAQFQLACLVSDPVLWCQAFLREPTSPKDPWSFFPHQAVAMRHRGPKIFYTASEVGKTRHLEADTIYQLVVVGDCEGLITAPKKDHYKQTLREIVQQFESSPGLKLFFKNHEKIPHDTIYLHNGSRVYFRSAGYDGEHFRNFHIKDFIKVDEAAKLHHPYQWSELWRAALPSCVPDVFSVPDGRRDTEFFRLGQLAKARAEGKEVETDEKDRPKGSNFEFMYIHWPKSIMPEPFWSPARERELKELLGGVDDPRYQHNVEGKDGVPESAVWPMSKLKHCIKAAPDYRFIEISVDSQRSEVSCKVSGVTLRPGEDGPLCSYDELEHREFHESDFFSRSGGDNASEFKRFIRQALVLVPGVTEAGADLGFAMDPSEIIVSQKFGKVNRIIARLHMRHVTYDQQAEAIDVVDDFYSPQTWGIDAGNAGSAVIAILTGGEAYEEKNYEGRLIPISFGTSVPYIGEDGEEQLDVTTGKPTRVPMKVLATDIMTMRFQRQEIHLPPDPGLIDDLINHTSTQGTRHPIYSKSNDHTIDGIRGMTLGAVLEAEGTEGFFI